RVWQADGLPSGLYILKLRSAGETRTMKTMLIK
ncbi:MAG: T9SS type A sorting domain-containing protein, partial [Calditrichaeota bacterium]|nr:T9SS type A sorting domain-containing protein [Calditrichota bacterium]